MTRIDFYILGARGIGARERVACRLAEKAFNLGHRVWIHTASSAAAHRVDDLLWTFRHGSFVPHAIAGETADPAPVLIGTAQTPEPDEHDTLINLTDEVPLFFSRFDRTLELIDDDPDGRQNGRERFRFYRDRGYRLETHKL